MKKVKSTVILQRKTKHPSKNIEDWGLFILSRKRVIQEILQQWLKGDNVLEIELEVIIKSKFQFKTSSQLGYLHVEIFPQWYKYYAEQGYATENKAIQEKIRNDIKLTDDVGFYNRVENDIDKTIYKHPLSFSKTSKEDMVVYIDRIIRLGNEFGIKFVTPEEYKKTKEIKEFSK